MIPAIRACLLTAMILCVWPARAQEQTGRPDTADAALSAKQEMVRDQIARLVDRMYRLSEALKESEPAGAAKLRDALQETQERLVQMKVEQAVALLKERHLEDARSLQTQLLEDLNAVLKTMLAGPDESQRLRSEIERLEAFSRELGKLIERQQGHLEATRQAGSDPARAEAVARALQQVSDLLNAQQSLSRSTAEQGPERIEGLAPEQRALAERTKETAEEVTRMDGGAESQTESPVQAAGQALEQAAGEMSEAAEEMDSDEPAKAGESQRLAEEALKRAIHELRKEQQRPPESPDLKQLAKGQRQTQRQTGQLSRDMGGRGGASGQGQDGGEQQGGGQEGDQSEAPQQDGQQQPAPGADRVERAEREMGRGAENLEQENREQAEQDQAEALEELHEARRELEETLEQLRKQEQLDTLANLEERLREILNRQLRVNRLSADLAAKPAQSWERADELMLAETVGEQKANREATGLTLHILQEDATTVAFPHVVGQVREDMELVVDRLTRRLLDPLTLRVEADIVETLEELLAAIERKKQELQDQNQGDGGSQEGNPPLLPTSAELKLLKQSQLRINRRTQLLAGQQTPSEAAPDSLTRQSTELSERQKDLAELAREMHTKATEE